MVDVAIKSNDRGCPYQKEILGADGGARCPSRRGNCSWNDVSSNIQFHESILIVDVLRRHVIINLNFCNDLLIQHLVSLEDLES